ncbi:hypothetical protein NHX12_007450 [Muraenolepis orangiensis]|uniref:Uncharacterized protein n=1 Tax=Muraenolepis orangiensis TaxID=630683 RepID=A0A9Q0DRM1_9TELE|nr:hypothetical protein NHX12_007450 [Muraenolepis orangiensis]
MRRSYSVAPESSRVLTRISPGRATGGNTAPKSNQLEMELEEGFQQASPLVWFLCAAVDTCAYRHSLRHSEVKEVKESAAEAVFLREIHYFLLGETFLLSPAGNLNKERQTLTRGHRASPQALYVEPAGGGGGGGSESQCQSTVTRTKKPLKALPSQLDVDKHRAAMRHAQLLQRAGP